MKKVLIGGLVTLLLSGCAGKENNFFPPIDNKPKVVSQVHSLYHKNYHESLEFIEQSCSKPEVKKKEATHKEILQGIERHITKDSRVTKEGDTYIFHENNLKIEIGPNHITYKKYPTYFFPEGRFVYDINKDNRADAIVSFGGDINLETEFFTDLFILKSSNNIKDFQNFINDKEQDYMPLIVAIRRDELVHFFDFRNKKYDIFNMWPEFNSALDENVESLKYYFSSN